MPFDFVGCLTEKFVQTLCMPYVTREWSVYIPMTALVLKR
jgi:hypothetical protein